MGVPHELFVGETVVFVVGFLVPQASDLALDLLLLLLEYPTLVDALNATLADVTETLMLMPDRRAQLTDGGPTLIAGLGFQLRERRQVGQVTQAEILEDGRCRGKPAVIVERDELTLQQRADGAVAAGAADAFDAAWLTGWR